MLSPLDADSLQNNDAVDREINAFLRDEEEIKVKVVKQPLTRDERQKEAEIEALKQANRGLRDKLGEAPDEEKMD